MDIGIKPDLGDLLKNLEVANDLLDAAEQKFRSISDVVGSTTQRLTQATRQTSLFAAETQRLQGSWNSIAAASGTLAGIGSAAMGGGYGYGGGGYGGGYGYGGPYIPGQTAFQGMSMPAMQPQMEYPSYGGSQEDIARYEPPAPSQSQTFPNMALLQLEQGKELLQSKGIAGGNNLFGKAISNFKAGYANKLAGRPLMPKPPALSEATQNALNAAQGLTPMATGAAEDVAGAGMMEGLGSLAASAAGPLAIGYAGFEGAKKAYNIWAENTAAARRLSGLTGDTGLFSGTGGGIVGLSTRARFTSLVNPGVDYAGIQEQALGAGYTGGEYSQSRDYMFEAAKRGLGDVIDQLDVYQEAVDKGGASVGELTSAMDRMRYVAANTNSSLTDMAKNYKSNLEQYISMGMSGGAANYAALTSATAFPMAGGLFALNPVLRNLPGYDISSPFLRAQTASSLGTTYTGLEGSLFRNPALGSRLPVAEENVSQTTLKSMGFSNKMSLPQISKALDSLGGAQVLPALTSMGVLPATNPDGTPMDYGSAVEFIAGNMSSNPMKQRRQDTKNAMAGTSLQTAVDQQMAAAGLGSHKVTSADVTGYLNSQGVAGTHMGSGLAAWKSYDNPDKGLVDWYSNELQNNGMTSPLLNKILSDPTQAANDYVQDPKTKGAISLLDYLKQAGPAGLKKLTSGKVRIGMADAATQQQLTSGGLGWGNQAVQDMFTHASTPEQIMASGANDGSVADNASAPTVMQVDSGQFERLLQHIDDIP